MMGRRAEVVSWKQLRNPPRHLKGVSEAIVLRARESRAQGKGPQLCRRFGATQPKANMEEAPWRSAKGKRS